MEESVTLTPAGSAWLNLVRGWKRPAEAAGLRQELGLPGDAAIVLTGHQAEFWHAGILAKYLAAQGLAESLSASGVAAATAWLVVDQDSNEPALVRYPARREGRLVAAWWKLGEPLGSTMDVPTGCRPALKPGAGTLPPATEAVAAGLERMRGALQQSECPTAAGQLTCATAALTRGLIPSGVPVYASRLMATTLGAQVIERMARDPAGCVEWYNRAVAGVPEAGLKPLNAARGELPLWHLRAGEPRKRVHASQLSGLPREQLAPRALLTTALVRRAACDLMIHGTGGAVYDRATEAWVKQWLGWELAPKVAATATRFVPMGAEAPVKPEEAAREIWRAHHARHDPGVLGDEWAARRKRDLVEEIREAKRLDRDPGALFDQMHRLLGQVRMESSTALAELSQRAQVMRQRLSDAAATYDRTWAFALHAPDALLELKNEIFAELGR